MFGEGVSPSVDTVRKMHTLIHLLVRRLGDRVVITDQEMEVVRDEQSFVKVEIERHLENLTTVVRLT